VTATSEGPFPTGTVVVTVFVAVSITDTVLSLLFEIYENEAAFTIFTSIKITATDTKAREYNLCLLIIYLTLFLAIISPIFLRRILRSI
jgi:hypothetical protein